MTVYFDASAFMAKCNEIMAKEKDKDRLALMREMKALALDCTKPISLEKKIRTLVFNSDGRMSLDKATLIVLKDVPIEGAYDYLFGGMANDNE